MHSLLILASSCLSLVTSLYLTYTPPDPSWIASGSHDPECYTQGLSFLN